MTECRRCYKHIKSSRSPGWRQCGTKPQGRINNGVFDYRIYCIRFVFVCQAVRQRFCRARGGIPKEFSVCKKAADLPNRVLSGIGGLTDDSSATFDNSISNLYALVKRFGNGFAARGADFALAGGDGTPKAPFAYKKQPKPRLTPMWNKATRTYQQWGLRLLPVLYQICIRLSSGSTTVLPRAGRNT